MGRVSAKLLPAAHSFFKIVLDFVYPPCCLVCKSSLQEDENLVCQNCWQSQTIQDPLFLPVTKMRYIPGRKKYLDGSIAAFSFSRQTQEIIHLYKYKKYDQLAVPLGHAICEAFASIQLDIDFVVSVPLHKKRQRERGFNQAQLLADVVGDRFSFRVETDILKRSRYTQPQAKMTRQARIENVQGAFALSHPGAVRKKRVLLVDDVMTTGSTMNECARLLKQAGADAVYCLSIARI